MIRTFMLSLTISAALTLPALADACQDDVAKIDAAVSAQELDADRKSQVEDMRSQAVQLCGAGNVDEGLAVTAELKAMLAIE